jgi:class 3 adenylate cyclase
MRVLNASSQREFSVQVSHASFHPATKYFMPSSETLLNTSIHAPSKPSELVSDQHAAERSAIDELNRKAWDTRNLNAAESAPMAQEAYNRSLAIDYARGRATAAITLGLRASFFGDSDKTMRYGQEALALLNNADADDEDRLLTGRVHFLMGFAYWNTGRYDEGLESALRGLDASREMKDRDAESWCYYTLGTFYFDLNDFQQALEYYERGLVLSRELRNLFAEVRILTGIGAVCMGLGDYDRALEYIEQSLALARAALNNPPFVARALNDMGQVYQHRGDAERALQLYLEALDIREQAQHSRGVITTLINIGSLFVQQHSADDTRESSADQALPYLNRALAMAESIDAKPRIYRVHQLLAEVYELMGNPARALWHFKAFYRVREQVTGDEHNLRFKALKSSFDAEQSANAAEIARLKNVELVHANTQLSSAFQLVENERSRAEELLLNILPPAIAEKLKTSPGVIAESYDDVTVLFADIVGFTGLSAHHAPEELVEILNWIFSDFDILTEHYGLEKIKTIGDAYMMASGLPDVRADHAHAAAAIALDMLAAIDHFSEQSGMRLCIRIGIHSGPVVAGVIGTKKFIYDLWGDTVNTASRMESHGEPSMIHVSEDFRRKFSSADANGNEFVFEPRGTLDIKGKGLMNTYFLTGKMTEKHKP